MSLTEATRPASRGVSKPSSPRPKVRVPWLVAAAGVFVLGVMLVLWAVSNASDRTQVLVVVEPVAAGEPLPDSAIGVTGVSNESGFGRIYLESQRAEVVGAIAVGDLAPGDILGPSMLTGAPDTFDGERLVGAVLRAGRYPEEIQRGDTGLAVSTADRSTDAPPAIEVRVVAVEFSETDEASITLAVPEAEAALVGTWAGTDELVIVVQPVGAEQ